MLNVMPFGILVGRLILGAPGAPEASGAVAQRVAAYIMVAPGRGWLGVDGPGAVGGTAAAGRGGWRSCGACVCGVLLCVCVPRVLVLVVCLLSSPGYSEASKKIEADSTSRAFSSVAHWVWRTLRCGVGLVPGQHGAALGRKVPPLLAAPALPALRGTVLLGVLPGQCVLAGRRRVVSLNRPANSGRFGHGWQRMFWDG